MSNDFDISDVIKDSTAGIKKTFGKKTPYIIGGGLVLAVGFGIYALRSGSGKQAGLEYTDITAYDPGLPHGSGSPEGGGGAGMESFFADVINMQMDTADLIYSQRYELDRLAGEVSALKDFTTQDKAGYFADAVPAALGNNAAYVNQGVQGQQVLESFDSIIDRQKVRYDRAAESGNTQYMEIVKKETESVTGQKMDWGNKGSSGSIGSSGSSGSVYKEGGIIYENKGGVITKDGRAIAEKDYKYIPVQVGGTRK